MEDIWQGRKLVEFQELLQEVESFEGCSRDFFRGARDLQGSLKGAFWDLVRNAKVEEVYRNHPDEDQDEEEEGWVITETDLGAATMQS